MATPRKTKTAQVAASKSSRSKAEAKAAPPKRAAKKSKASAKRKVLARAKSKTEAKAAPPKRAAKKSKASAKRKVPARAKSKTEGVGVGKGVGTRKGRTAAKKPAAPGRVKVAAKKKPRPTAPVKTKRPPAKAKPRKPAVDAEMQKKLREALVTQRRRLLSVVQSTRAQMAEKTGDLADISDRASEGYGAELAVGLVEIEAAQLDEIETALRRIDEGTYGLCVDCGKPIPRKRLEVLPFAQRCLGCKGKKERRLGPLGGYGDEAPFG